MKKLLLSTISILLIVVFSAILFVACSPRADIDPEEVDVAQNTYVSQEPIEITPISVLSKMEPVTFGKFPQSLKGDVTVSEKASSDGYYLGSDGKKYYKDGSLYYLLEDIVWDAYELDSGDILLISQKILTAARYDDYHDFFEFEKKVFDTDLFSFTTAETKRIQTIGVEYGTGFSSSTKMKAKLFFINIDTITYFYPTTSKIVKQSTTFAAAKMKSQAGIDADWWLAPSKGRGYYVTNDGVISNKDNTYLDTSGELTRIAYARRGIAPALVISA